LKILSHTRVCTDTDDILALYVLCVLDKALLHSSLELNFAMGYSASVEIEVYAQNSTVNRVLNSCVNVLSQYENCQ